MRGKQKTCKLGKEQVNRMKIGEIVIFQNRRTMYKFCQNRGKVKIFRVNDQKRSSEDLVDKRGQSGNCFLDPQIGVESEIGRENCLWVDGCPCWVKSPLLHMSLIIIIRLMTSISS